GPVNYTTEYGGSITNNLLYNNGGDGIIVHDANIAAPFTPKVYVTSNTVYQTSGDALVVDRASRDISIRNNIFWVQAGVDPPVPARSQHRFVHAHNDPLR